MWLRGFDCETSEPELDVALFLTLFPSFPILLPLLLLPLAPGLSLLLRKREELMPWSVPTGHAAALIVLCRLEAAAGVGGGGSRRGRGLLGDAGW
jgi:hypothetical protein